MGRHISTAPLPSVFIWAGAPRLLAVMLVCVVTEVSCGGSKPPPGDGGTRDAAGREVAFAHPAGTGACAECHDTNKPYAAVPSTGHRPTGGLDCGHCHAIVDGSPTWAGARFHALGSATPATCLPCHGQQAPTSTAGWLSTTYTISPFDYGTNSLGIAHGGDQDCVVCHKGPGTGSWGERPNWADGHFVHQPFSLSETTCIACHVSQRPDLQPGATAASAAAQVGFDHARYPRMDCIGCHWATVAADTYVHYLNPATSTLPGGDWKGGQSYPGATPVGFPGERITLETTKLSFSEAQDFVTGATRAYEEVPDIMIHTAPIVPAEVQAGPAEAPDYDKCWHCHPNQKGVVTMFPPGKFHVSLKQYRSTPDAPVTPLAQPTHSCKECHAVTRPPRLIGRSPLRPMDHGSAFASPAIVAGVPATGVRDLDCSVCHKDPWGLFRDGEFHAPTAAATPKECVGCHYLTMADGPTSDRRNGTAYQMRHTSSQVTFHTCTTCHPSALANATQPTITAQSWSPGYYHTVLTRQPTACNDCHTGSLPIATLVAFDHAALDTSARDCGECHTFPGTGTAALPNWLGATRTW